MHPALPENLSLNQLLATIPSGLFLVDRAQTITYWNHAAANITGYSSDEALGRHCSFLEGTPCNHGTCSLFDPQIEKPFFGTPCTIRHRNGHRITILKNVDLLRNAAGDVIGGIESFIDITAQKELEDHLRQQTQYLEDQVAQRLRQEYQRLRSTLDGMSDFAYICDSQFRVTYMNDAMQKVFGPHENRYCYELFHGRDEPCPQCPIAEVLNGAVLRKEAYFDANERTYEANNSPLHTPQGDTEKLAVFRDITERKEAEEKLQATNAELDAFVYTVSHDLRKPLTPIVGYADHLLQNYNELLPQSAQSALQHIQDQSQTLLQQLEDLLVLSRVGRLQAPQKPVAAGQIVQRVQADLCQQMQQKNAQLQWDSALPFLWLSETLLYQIYLNYIGNALSYGCPHNPQNEITIGAMQIKQRLRLYVRDHGPGIPPQERNRIFDLFYRGSTSNRHQGTGIGLATIRKIARLYNGRAWVEDTPGGGATFVFEIPASYMAENGPDLKR